MSAIRSASVLARRTAIRPVTLRSSPLAPRFRRTFATVPPTPSPPPPPSPSPPLSGSSGNSNITLYVLLATLAALGAGGYYYLKPVRDVAAVTHQAIETVKEQTSGLGDLAQQYSGIAQSFLPPSALALYNQISQQPGGINGFLSNLKDKDLQGVLDEVKKVGGEDVKRIVEKVESQLKAAKGKAQDVDWKGLAQDLKSEFGDKAQQAIDFLVGQIPSKEDVDKLVAKAKEIGEEQLKQVEKTASKVLAEVERAKKDGKASGDALLKGLKDAAPADVDELIKQLKSAANKAGLPADTIESWLKSKAEDGKVNAEETAKQVKDKLQLAAKTLPGEPKDLVKQVEQFSPSVAKLLQQALQEAGVVDEKGNRKK